MAEGVKVTKSQGLDLNLKYEASWVCWLFAWLVGMRDGGLRESRISQGGLGLTV